MSFMRQLWRKLQTDKSGAILARGAIGSFVVKILGAAIAFGLHILLARLLGVTQYGIYIYALTWINILVVASLLGLNTSLVRFIASYKAQERWGLLRGIIRRSTQFGVVFSLVISGIGVIVVLTLRNRIGQDEAATFGVALILLPVLVLVRLREASLRALKRVARSELPFRIIRPLLLAAVVSGLYLYLRQSLQATQAMTGNLIAVFVALLIGTVWLFKELPQQVRDAQPVYAEKEWLRVSLPLLLIDGMLVVLKQTDIIMLGAIRGPDEAGIYSAASRISNLVVFALAAINAILAPMISELYITGKIKELQRIVTLAAQAIFVFTMMFSIILAGFGKFALSLFGAEFVVTYVPLLILLSGQIVNALAGSVGLIMIMTGHQNQAGAIVAVSAAVNVILNALLIPLIGLVGAAISTTFTMVLWNIAMLVYVQRRLGINPTLITKRL
jgi:O-antigen/teichoic acid export membrane protein